MTDGIARLKSKPLTRRGRIMVALVETQFTKHLLV